MSTDIQLWGQQKIELKRRFTSATPLLANPPLQLTNSLSTTSWNQTCTVVQLGPTFAFQENTIVAHSVNTPSPQRIPHFICRGPPTTTTREHVRIGFFVNPCHGWTARSTSLVLEGRYYVVSVRSRWVNIVGWA